MFPTLRRNILHGLVARRNVNALVANIAAYNNGAVYDYSRLDSLNELSTGTIPVAVVTDPVGLSLDTRLGMALGAELAPVFDASWTRDASVTISGNSFVFTNTPNNANGAYKAIPLTVGKAYKITVNVSGYIAGGITAFLGGQQTTVSNSPALSANGVFAAIVIPTGAYNTNFIIGTVGITTCSVDILSVKLLDGNHALQATAGARPTWQVDAQGFYYLSFLGTPVNLTSATGGGGSAGLLYCRVIQPTGGAGTLRTLWADNGTNTGYKIQLDVNNKLSFSAGNGTAFTTLASTAALSVGTKYLVTVRDNGTNLSVQIGTAAAETVARPVVVAGTAGFTIGKDNGAASSYDITNQYSGAYFKDTGLTDAQVASVQSWVKSKAGL